jgi:c-di-GMP-binding flagellar brake protein YcgR
MTREESAFKDRRRFVRVDIYAVTRYFCPFRDSEVGIQTRISDISEAGLLLVTFMEGIPLEAKVKTSFLMPGNEGRLISVEGVVRHTGPLEKEQFRSGMEFSKIKEKDRKIVREYVLERKKK